MKFDEIILIVELLSRYIIVCQNLMYSEVGVTKKRQLQENSLF